MINAVLRAVLAITIFAVGTGDAFAASRPGAYSTNALKGTIKNGRKGPVSAAKKIKSAQLKTSTAQNSADVSQSSSAETIPLCSDETNQTSKYCFWSDMVLEREQLRMGSTNNQSGDVSTPMLTGVYSEYNPRFWTNGVVPIEFAAGISEYQKNLFYTTCLKWTQVANVRCAPRTNEENFLLVNNAFSGCYSNVGMGIGRSVLNLNNDGCWNNRTILHELGHTLGFLHEHSRLDRDEYVVVNADNIQPALLWAYERVNAATSYTSYDFLSIMHYYWNHAAINPSEPTLIPRPDRPEYAQYARSMGSGFNGNPSQADAAGISQIYGPPIVVIPTSPITVVITDTANRPIPGAIVNLRNTSTTIQVVANNNGIATDNIPHAEYSAWVSADGYYSTNAVNYNHRTTLPAYPVRLIKILSTTSRITARFYDASTVESSSLAYVNVDFTNVRTGITTRGTSNTEGALDVTLTNGTYNIASTKEGYHSLSYRDVSFGGDYSVPDSIPMHSTTQSVVDIRIVDRETGAPVEGATVEVTRTENNTPVTVTLTTNAQGRVRESLPHSYYSGSVTFGSRGLSGAFYLSAPLSVEVLLPR